MHDKHRRSQTHRAPQSRLTRKQGPSAVFPERDLTAPGRSGIWAWRSARCALWVNLDATRVKVLSDWAWPPGPTRPRSDSSAKTLSLETAFDARNIVELAAGNGDGIQLFGPGHRYFEFYRSHGASIVPLLEVDDLDQASAEVAGSGAELLAGRSQTVPGPGSRR